MPRNGTPADDGLVKDGFERVEVAKASKNQLATKLDKPATPAADSVVTITAAGQVGTMPKTALGTGTVDTQPALDALAGL